MILQLNPPLPMVTPRGPGWAHALIDYGLEHDLLWVVFITETGEVWTYTNRDVRADKNTTYNRPAAKFPATRNGLEWEGLDERPAKPA